MTTKATQRRCYGAKQVAEMESLREKNENLRDLLKLARGENAEWS